MIAVFIAPSSLVSRSCLQLHCTLSLCLTVPRCRHRSPLLERQPRWPPRRPHSRLALSLSLSLSVSLPLVASGRARSAAARGRLHATRCTLSPLPSLPLPIPRSLRTEKEGRPLRARLAVNKGRTADSTQLSIFDYLISRDTPLSRPGSLGRCQSEATEAKGRFARSSFFGPSFSSLSPLRSLHCRPPLPSCRMSAPKGPSTDLDGGRGREESSRCSASGASWR